MKTQDSKRIRHKKRILKVTIRRMIDDSPDTSHLGEYSNRAANEFSIDRAHSEDCASVRPDIQSAKQTLEHVQQTVGDYHNAILAQYNGTLANAKLDAQREALDDAYDEVGELIEDIDACDCGEHGDMGRNELRYFNPSFNYVTKEGRPADGLTPEEVRKYTRQDYERMESANRGDWCMIGIRAEADVQLELDARTTNVRGIRSPIVQTIISGGLWGVESDADRSYFEEVQKDELSNLKSELLALGFSKRAIAQAFKPENIKEKDE